MSLALVDHNSVAGGTRAATSQALLSFGLDMFSKIRQGHGSHPKNVFFSPFSVSAAMGLVYAGSQGQTQEELTAAMHVSQPEADYHLGLSALMQRLGLAGPSKVPGIDLSIANKLWLSTQFTIKPEYRDVAVTRYGAPAETVNFAGNPEGERERINGYIAEHTKQLIRDLLPSGSVTADTLAIITNAIYFKGTWTKTFDRAHTVDAPFYKLGSTQVHSQVPMMFAEMNVRYKHTGDYQAIELPYGPTPDDNKAAQLSMVLMLPEENTPKAIDDMIKSIEGPGFRGLVDQMFETKVKIHLPRFKLEDKIDMTGLLQAMGITSAFASTANFSRLSDQHVIISKVLHQAVVKVNEEGTEAAAATAVIMKRAAAIGRPEPLFCADHPFVFFVWDRWSRTVLFLGQCVEPQSLS